MNRKTLNVLTAIALLLTVSLVVSIPSDATAQTRSRAATGAYRYLPASDGIVVVDVNRLMNETLPRVFAANADKLAHINTDIEKFKSKTGVDPRAFDRVVIGTRYTYPSATVTKLETVAIAQGKFDVKSLADAGREAAKGKQREEKYHGATIMIFGIDDQMKLFGLWNMKVKELAVCALNANTLAIGSPATVRAAIDAGRNRRSVNGELIALATRDPQAVLGFGANMSRNLMQHLDLGMDAVARDVNSIRQVYGAIGSANTDVSLSVVARTETADSAKNLGDTVTSLTQLAGLLVFRMKPDQRALAQGALSNLKITTRGNELEIRTQIAAANLAAVIK